MFSGSSLSKIEYTLKKYKRSKSVKLLIRANGEVVVTAPIRVSQKYIDSFIEKQSSWIQDKIGSLKKPNTSKVKTEEEDLKTYKEKTRKIIEQQIEQINTHYNFKYKNISIRNQKTRWGSCSSKGNLNFSYKLFFLPVRLSEYIVAHELCHLKEMNHGPNFWKLVSETIPDYQKRRIELERFKI